MNISLGAFAVGWQRIRNLILLRRSARNATWNKGEAVVHG